MARPRVPITQSDLQRFVENDSDFAFEMQVLAQLRTLGFHSEHSGTYRDPVTDKVRQFDIRAWKDHGTSTLVLAVECKNLHQSRPLLISAVPRTPVEAFHDRILLQGGPVARASSIRHVDGTDSAYKPGEMVGKKTDQVGKDDSGELVSDDQATFDKLNQALNSCQGLVQRFFDKPSVPLLRVIVPVLAVPSGVLWQVDYSPDGTLQAPPRQVPQATLFVNHGWSVDRGAWAPLTYHLSHIEFVTVDALPSVTDTWLGNDGFFSANA
jgi:hypothetical protein